MTLLLEKLAAGDSTSSNELFNLVYDELRVLANRFMNKESSGHTLQTTALVHEAYLRLVSSKQPQGWEGRSHFFFSAAEAMRRILVEHARRKKGKKRGGDHQRVSAEAIDGVEAEALTPEFVLEVHEALDRLAEVDPQSADIIRLRFFAGLSVVEAADIVGVSKSTAYANWEFAKARLSQLL